MSANMAKFPKSSELLRFCEHSFIARLFVFLSCYTSNAENEWKVFNRTYIFSKHSLLYSFWFSNNFNKGCLKFSLCEYKTSDFSYAFRTMANILKAESLVLTKWVENQSALNKQYGIYVTIWIELIKSANIYNVSKWNERLNLARQMLRTILSVYKFV